MPWEIPLVRQLTSVIVYITAAPHIRFERMRTRGEKPGEKSLNWQKFRKEELALTEIHIPGMGREADWQIRNEGTLDAFRWEVAKFLKHKLQLLWEARK